MQAYQIETTLTQGGVLTLTQLPFQKGDVVEIIILRQPMPSTRPNTAPLRGTVVTYIDPTAPVAQDDWEVKP